MGTYFESGSWNVICQVCGRQFKADEIRKRWDGLLVCTNDYENRHILDFIKAHPEESVVPFTSPEPSDQFIFSCVFPQTVGMADIGTADCAIAGFSVTSFPHERKPSIAGVAVAGLSTPAKDNPYD